MLIENPLKMNDWAITKFIRIVLVFQLAIWGTIGLKSIGIEIPLLREIVAFIYLTYIPGIVIIRILKLHRLGDIETLLYSVGLSITTLMFTGYFMNTFYPHIGISKPLSSMPLLITISVIVLILCAICHRRDKDFCDTSYIEIKDIFSVPVLFLFLLPFLALFGTYLVNFYQNNIGLILLFIVISVIALLIGFNKFIPKKLYPLTVFVIAISLLFHNSLISMYIWGWDIQLEYYYSNLVLANSLWDSTIYHNVNAMLSISMIGPIFSNISGMSLTWVFKIIYPLLFSLVPLGLYQVLQKQLDEKIAFLSLFFFMGVNTFYIEMLQVARQQIAEFYLVLMIILIIDNNMNRINRSILLILFALSLVISHYGVSYIFMGSLIIVWILVNFNKPTEHMKNKPTITLTFVLIFITFALSWYMYISSSSTFKSIVQIGNHIVTTFYGDFLNPEASEGVAIILKESPSFLHDMNKYIHLIAQFFISVGLFGFLLNNGKIKFKRDYVAFSIVNFIILLAGIAVPYFASSLNTSRLYQISLIFLAPFCIVGGIIFFKIISKIFIKSWKEKYDDFPLKFISIFLVFFLLFNSGFIYQLANDIPRSFSLSNNFDFPIFSEKDYSCAIWLYNSKSGAQVYADYNREVLFRSLVGDRSKRIPSDRNNIKEKSYIFVGNFNITETEYVNKDFVTYSMNKIFVNGGSQIYIR